MNNKNLRMRAVLLILGASGILSAAARPPIPTAPPATVQPIFLPDSTSSSPGPTALPHVELLTKTTGTNVFTMPIEPHWTIGTNTQVTGAIVDSLNPQQTWKMLNPPPESEKELPWQTTSSRLPATGPQFFNSDLAVHGADFALIRFSLGSPPKLPKVQP